MIFNNSKYNKGYRIENLFKLMKKLKCYTKNIVLAITGGLFNHLFTILSSALCAYMVGIASTKTSDINIKPLLILLCFFIIMRAIMYYVESYFSHDVAFRILSNFRVDLYDAVEKVSPAILLDMRLGQLASTLMSDVEILEIFFAHTFGGMIVALIVPFISIAFISTISIKIAIIMLIFLIVTMTIPFIMKNKANEQGKMVREKLSDANAVSIEGIHGMKEILTLNYKEKYRTKNNKYMSKLYSSQFRYGKRLGSEGGLLHFSISIAIICVTIIAIKEVSIGKLSFEWFTTIVMLSSLTFSPVLEVCNAARNLGLVIASSNRVFNVLESRPLVNDNGKGELLDKKYDIKFENVSFKYKDNLDYSLSNVNLEIKEGEMVALVGHSGAGKSTCINLLLRYWDVSEGCIKIGNKDIREVSLDSLRNKFSVVLQEVYLFNISILENIRLANPSASDKMVKTVSQIALAHEFIMGLEDGYNTIVGERGAQLSGGQRQRIAIARALLKDSPIIILDEAVSNLDTENEKNIDRSIRKNYNVKTKIVIAHRLSTIMSADKIVVMDNSKIVQVGTHNELMKSEDMYKNLVLSQLENNN